MAWDGQVRQEAMYGEFWERGGLVQEIYRSKVRVDAMTRVSKGGGGGDSSNLKRDAEVVARNGAIC